MPNTVLIFGFDGLQPAQVTPELMPNLSALAAGGVDFQAHHSVSPTVTRVNVASLMTGRSPGGHGLAGNSMLVRDFDPDRPINALQPDMTQVIEKTGRLLIAPTLAEIIGASDAELVSVGSGSTGNSFLQNSNPAFWGGATINPSFSLPDGLQDEVEARFGPWPSTSDTDTERIGHSIGILTDYALTERQPAAAIFWSSDPDKTQHAAGVGSDMGTQALSGADRQLGRLLEWLDTSGRAGETDIFVVSDHGYSTIKGIVDVEARVREAGFPPGGGPGGVIVADNGGSVLFYVHEGDRATADRLAGWLMAQPWCGALLASLAVGEIEGALPAASVGLDGERAADLTMSFAWSPEANDAGYEGHGYATGGAAGLGTHGSMGRSEQRCVLIASGPSFKRGAAVHTPTGNIDVAPTVLRILGVDGGQEMDGRVLEEALLGGPDAGAVDSTNDVLRAERNTDGGVYLQELSVSRVGSTIYVDHGNRG